MSLPDYYVPMDRRGALATGQVLEGRRHGTALFADVSGFTALTGALTKAHGMRRGAEEVTRQLFVIFTGLTDRVHRFGGSVLMLSGDALTCWFDGDDGARAMSAAWAMKTWMPEAADSVEQMTGLRPDLKIGLATGTALRMAVGDPEIQRLDIIAGSLLAEMAGAEKVANPGEVLVSSSTLEAASLRFQIDETRVDAHGGSYARLAGVESITMPEGKTCAQPSPDQSRLEPWILSPVRERLRSGAGDYQAELRPVATLFISFGGIDADLDPDAAQRLDAWIRHVQRAAAQLGGWVLNLTVGDKGSYCLVAFGAPVAHPDDLLRAATVGLKLRTPPAELAFIPPPAIGLTWGEAYAGAYGGEAHRAYSVIGDPINMAARLMGLAAGGTLLTESSAAALLAHQLESVSLGPRKVKGKAIPLEVSELRQRSRTPSGPRPLKLEHPLIGREETLKECVALLQSLDRGEGVSITLAGSPGMGRTRMLEDVRLWALARGLAVYTVSCFSLDLELPYRPLSILLFQVLEEQGLTCSNMSGSQILTRLSELFPGYQERLPLLGDLLDLDLPSTPMVRTLSGRVRRESLHSLVLDLLSMLARTKPILFLLDDAQWMDEASRDFCDELSRSVKSIPIALILTRVSGIQSTDTGSIRGNRDETTRIELPPLNESALNILLESHLGGLISSLVLALTTVLSQGIPSIALGVASALKSSGDMVQDSQRVWRASAQLESRLEAALALDRQGTDARLIPERLRPGMVAGLPDTVQAQVLSALDLLPELERTTLKVAAVIGQPFDAELIGSLLPGVSIDPMDQSLTHLVQSGFLASHGATGSSFALSQAATGEVAYETLLFEQRRQLHRSVAVAYEQRESISPEGSPTFSTTEGGWYPILAYHWRKAEAPGRERVYALLAGESQAARYANLVAFASLSRALDLTDISDDSLVWRIRKTRADVSLVLGFFEQALSDLQYLGNLARTMNDPERALSIAIRTMAVHDRAGQYPEMLAVGDSAQALTDEAMDVDTVLEFFESRAAGLWRARRLDEALVMIDRGLKLAHQAQRLKSVARLLRQGATVHYLRGDLTAARAHIEEAIAQQRKDEDLLQEAMSLQLLIAVGYAQGDLLLAEDAALRSLALLSRLGYRSLQATGLSNLAILLFELGELDHAERLGREALAHFETLGDRQSRVIALYNLALVRRHQGYGSDALALAEDALQSEEELAGQASPLRWRCKGEMLLHEGRWEAAAQALARAEAMAAQADHKACLWESRLWSAHLAMLRGDHATARSQLPGVREALMSGALERFSQPLSVLVRAAEDSFALGEWDPAEGLVARGQEWLKRKADGIGEPKRRALYLVKAPGARELEVLAQRLAEGV